MKAVLLVLSISLLLTFLFVKVEFKIEKRNCLEYAEKTYKDSTGLSLWVATKNPAFLAQNGYKTRTVCVKWENNE